MDSIETAQLFMNTGCKPAKHRPCIRRGTDNPGIRWAIELKRGWLAMDLNRVEAQVLSENLKSVALLARLGFRYEGLLLQCLTPVQADPVHYASYVYAIRLTHIAVSRAGQPNIGS
jgi:hypothetical protein